MQIPNFTSDKVIIFFCVGISSLAGVVVLILMIPVNAWLANRVEYLQVRQMELKDERVKLTNEVSKPGNFKS